MNRTVEVREFDSIVKASDSAMRHGYVGIEEKEFDALLAFAKEFSAEDDCSDALDFMRIAYKRGVGDMIAVKNYVGLIQMKNGFQVQILPKIDFDDGADSGNERTKRIFLKMLRSMKDFPSKVFNEASLRVDRMNLYEIYINMYLQETRKLVKHGLQSAYLMREDNLRFYKGKLLVGQNIRRNLAHKERFFMAYDEFHQNRPENRLVKSTLIKLQKMTNSAENSKEIRQLLSTFEFVEESKNYERDFSNVIIDRNMTDYKTLMSWSKVFLFNKSFTTFSGNVTSRALLFPMESVYESYVAQQVRRAFAPYGWNVSCQDSRYYLFESPYPRFRIRPDIVLRRGNRVLIMDTKWKKLFNDESRNYGISQADMYQMYAYAKKYDTSEVWLLYPATEDMKGHAPIYYKSNDLVNVKLSFLNLENTRDQLDELALELS